MIGSDKTANTPTSYTCNACGSRLPCGLCMITNSMCPLAWQYTPIRYDNGYGTITTVSTTGTIPTFGSSDYSTIIKKEDA